MTHRLRNAGKHFGGKEESAWKGGFQARYPIPPGASPRNS